MTIEENMKKVLAEEAERAKNLSFQSLRDFYEQAKKEGIAIKHEYTLPQFDSIGRRFYSTQKTDPKQQ